MRKRSTVLFAGNFGYWRLVRVLKTRCIAYVFFTERSLAVNLQGFLGVPL